MRIVIVTGMSGAGKRTALKALEDAGYYCVDNLPVPLILKFLELARSGNDVRSIALGVDVRSGEDFGSFSDVLDTIHRLQYPYEVLYLDAENEVLIKRYKETRRNHPLAGDDRIMDGIKRERKATAFLKKRADYIIDTSTLLTRDLKLELEKIFVSDEEFDNLVVTILSFGFKYGIPEDADLIFDVRFLPNPYYIDDLKKLTGMDRPVRDYVMGFKQSVEFLDKLEDLIEFLIPNYIQEGKNRLVIGIGCTGGQHRSVTLAEELYQRLAGGAFGMKIDHRDIEVEKKVKQQ